MTGGCVLRYGGKEEEASIRASKSQAIAFSCVALLALLIALTVRAAASQPQEIDLAREFNVRIDGAKKGDELGRSVAGIGDMNRDGRPDVVIGAPGADSRGRTRNGAGYVVFGQRKPTVIDLARLGGRGFRIDGRGAPVRPPVNCPTCARVGFETIGYDVSGAGDVNGDRRPDVLLSAVFESGDIQKVRAYVVFGKSSREPVDLRHLGSHGFLMSAFAELGDPSEAGVRAAQAGDVNGDGRSDIMLAVPGFVWCDIFNRCHGEPFPGAGGGAYVVFGKRSSRPVDLLRLGRRGFRIIGEWPWTASSIAAVGDMNGDGRSELLLGAQGATTDGEGAGEAYVVFGGTFRHDVLLHQLGVRGFRIDGAPHDLAGASVSRAGDMNRDGRADILVGAPGAFDPTGARLAEESVYVVFGKSSPQTVSLATLGGDGFRIANGEGAGSAVASAGDANKDRRADVLIGAAGTSHNGRRDSGSVYVVFASASRDPVDIGAIPSNGRGYRIDGPEGRKACCFNSPIGLPGTLGSAGDVNRDGRSDVIVGSPFVDSRGRRNSGSVYIVFSP
jgi:hypothetical protein